MTPELRYDLFIEWQVTSTLTKQKIQEAYQEKYSTNQADENWEEYLVEALDIKHFFENCRVALEDQSSAASHYLKH